MKRNILLVLPVVVASLVTLVSSSTLIREKVRIPSFTIHSPVTKTVLPLTFPTTAPIPILQSLTITRTGNGNKLSVNSPFLPSPGSAILRRKKLQIKFRNPRIRIHLTISRSTSSSISVQGFARYKFRRAFGLRLEKTERTVPQAVNALKDALATNPSGPRLVTVVDHSAAAESVGLKLAPSSVVVFGNPAIGSQLWTRKPAIGIELPLEIVVVSSPLGTVYVGWNSASLLRFRFGVRNLAPVFETIDSVLARLATVAAGRELKPAGRRFDVDRIDMLDGVQIEMGKGDVIESFERLVQAVEDAPPVNVAYKVLHDVAAAEAGLDTRGLIDRVVVFGNPMLGTILMQQAFTAAIDLPVKMAVWAKEGGSRFSVGYTLPSWIARRHGADALDVLEMALERFASVAVGEE